MIIYRYKNSEDRALALENEEVTSYYDEAGILRERSRYVDDKREGKYEDWHPDGQPWERSFYKNGKLHGEATLQEQSDKTMCVHVFFKDGKNITDEIANIVSDVSNITKEEALLIKIKFGIPLLCTQEP